MHRFNVLCLRSAEPKAAEAKPKPAKPAPAPKPAAKPAVAKPAAPKTDGEKTQKAEKAKPAAKSKAAGGAKRPVATSAYNVFCKEKRVTIKGGLPAVGTCLVLCKFDAT